MVRTCLAPLALIALMGCVPAPAGAPAAGAIPIAGCPVLADRNWHAWIDTMPGPGARMTLNLSGEIDLPTPGYTLTLIPGPADRRAPPGLRFNLAASAPGGIVPQVVTPMQVTYRQPTPYAQIRQITIGCGGEALATIPDVRITQ